MSMTTSKTQETILRNGGAELNEDFIRHRSLYDVIQAIASASTEALHQTDETGAGLLHFAARLKDGLPIVRALLKKGLDPSIKDGMGNKPINYAKTAEMTLFLLRNPASQQQ